jgi:hypothetical protein
MKNSSPYTIGPMLPFECSQRTSPEYGAGCGVMCVLVSPRRLSCSSVLLCGTSRGGGECQTRIKLSGWAFVSWGWFAAWLLADWLVRQREQSCWASAVVL